MRYAALLLALLPACGGGGDSMPTPDETFTYCAFVEMVGGEPVFFPAFQLFHVFDNDPPYRAEDDLWWGRVIETGQFLDDPTVTEAALFWNGLTPICVAPSVGDTIARHWDWTEGAP